MSYETILSYQPVLFPNIRTSRKLIAGTWTSTPGKWRAFIDRDEFCTILDGKGELISETGETVAFAKFDSFMIPDGFRGFWYIIETTTKHFVIRQV